jgi:UDP-GlcNAc:undecaprenyl-phosphate GlcNAc-1-phosphate transferase
VLLFGSIVYLNKSGMYDIEIQYNLLIALFISSLIIFIVGFLDDSTFVTVRVRHKIIAELVIAFSCVYLLDIHFNEITILGNIVFPLWLSKIISLIWIIGLVNAFNLSDGIDGLAGGISFVAIATLGVIAYLSGQIELFYLCSVIAGALLGFLYFNIAPAKVFMGDSGSLFLGCMVAIISLYLGKEVVGNRSLLVFPLIAGIPIIEVAVTIVRRYCKALDANKKFPARINSIVIPDNSHIHHRCMFRGYSHFETMIVMCLVSVTLSCGALCIFLMSNYLIAVMLCYLALTVFLILDRLGFGGRFKKAIGMSKSRYNGFNKTAFVGVIDNEGELAEKLNNKKDNSVEYISITGKDISSIKNILSAAIINKQVDKDTINLEQAGEISKLLNGPVFMITPESENRINIMKVFKNGTLKTAEQKGSVNLLIKEIHKINAIKIMEENKKREREKEINSLGVSA